MNITKTPLKQIQAVALAGGLLLGLFAAPATTQAAVAMGEADPIVRESNSDSTIVASFSPELGSTITQGTSTDAVAYYGVVANSSASSSDVFWRITVSHATSTLLLGDVSITEKGWYDDFGHDVADSPYTPSVNLDGELVLTGNSGWGVEAGANFTNVDEISFSPTAPTGEYTITRELIDNFVATGTSMGGTHVLTVTLLAATSTLPTPDTTAPAAPVVTSPTSPHSTTTNPISVFGTAEASSTILITGGALPSAATTTSGGDWNAVVTLTPNATNTLSITATDMSANTSSSTSLIVVHGTTTSGTTTPDTTAPAAPVVISPTSPHSTTTNPISVFGTAEASSTILITGGAAPSAATTTSGGTWNASVLLNASSTNNLNITATDSSLNTSSSTSLIVIHGTSTSGTTTTATSSPVITINGDNPASAFSCNGYTDEGATARDSSGQTIPVTTTNNVNDEEPGTYTVTYTATDDEGRTATSTRTVLIRECSSGGGGGGGTSGDTVVSGSVIAGSIFPPTSPIGTSDQLSIGFVTAGQVFSSGGQVLGTTAFRFNVNLSVGSRGQDVIALQTRLTATGYYSGPITGYFGSLTRAAVVRFQAAHGLPQTGFVGPMTRAILNS